MTFRIWIAFITIIIYSCQSPSGENSIEEMQADSASVQPSRESGKEEPKDLPQEITTAMDDASVSRERIKLVEAPIALKSGEQFNLKIPDGWNISVAAEGLARLRFMAKSPDGRLFATDMYNKTDNSKGRVYIFEGFNRQSRKFDTIITYLDNLRNPNSLQFYTDKSGKQWLYLALTNKLVRYPYTDGDMNPSGAEEVLATFPDYGLSYKYGGWHLTRTIAIHDDQLYISVGSSCNVCEEKEDVRASVLVMDMDGGNKHHFAKGVRNTVGLKWVKGSLFSTNMGADHLGDDKPEEALYVIAEGRHYGWPYYYQFKDEIYADTTFEWHQDTLKANDIPKAWSPLGGHTAPLGFEYFEGEQWPPSIRNYFLVALHGSGKVKLNKGYEVVRSRKGHRPEPVITGFLQKGDRKGRPCDIFIWDNRSFFITDDHSGVLYYVEVE